MAYVGNVLVIASGVIAGSIELFTGGNISHIIWPFWLLHGLQWK
ncbi:TMhelix containing protein [Vibrio phage 1.149.O._10N.286.55.A12]|nr:TMhelix containing protein [Vibrio phage 1.149.O._10N.286.55.A12]